MVAYRYKIGDKIKYIGNELNDHFEKGKIFTIVKTPEEYDRRLFLLKYGDTKITTHKDWLYGTGGSIIQFKLVNNKITDWEKEIEK